MARLTIEQVKAPDFSASSEMMARANQSFTSGIGSAKDILGKYNEGQQAKGDQALIGALAGLSSEEELKNFLQTTDLSNMNISETMRENVLGARAVILGNNATRQSTSNAFDANSRANAGEGRVAAEYADGVAARDEQRGLTPAYIAALAEGQANGRGSGVVAGVDLGAVERNYNLPSGYMATMAQIESGGDPNAQNPNSSAGGLFQQLDANADAYGVANKFDPAQSADGAARFAVDNSNTLSKVLGRQPTGAELYLAHQQGPGGASALLSNPNARAVDIVGADAVRLNGGSADMTAGEFAGIWINKFNNIQGNAAPTDPTIRSNPMGGQAFSNLYDVMQAMTKMTPDAADKLFNSVIDQQAAGQSLIDTAEAKRQQEATAAAIIEAVRVGGSEAAVRNDLMDIYGVSAVNSVAAAGTDLSAFGQLISPSVNPDTEALSGMARARENDKNTSNEDVFALAKSFDSGVNTSPVGTLFKETGLDTKGTIEEITAYDTALARFAEAAEVSPSEAAAALAVISRSGVDIKAALQLAPDQEEYGTIVSLINKQVGPEAKAAYEVSQGERSRREADRASAELQLSAAQSYARKPGLSKVERAKAEAEVTRLRDSMVKGMTPQEREQILVDYISKTGMGSRLQGLDPNSAEFYRAMAQLEETIKTDSTLTANEKELLLRDIRG